ncbi:MAG: Co2+/Mg2+ efflux protein ApaG [Myxococcales bacterium]|nr:Co2+/Mg2+ efflux protein ApaG [Myxococcales bacterium]
MSEALTRGVRVTVQPLYLEDRSDPLRNYYFFAYFVTIANEGDEPVQLVSRHWIISDGTGKTQEVRGAGVVGHQPRLVPGQTFEYNSFCLLPTEVGSMRGSYQMVTDDGEPFDAVIAPFTLAVPTALN